MNKYLLGVVAVGVAGLGNTAYAQTKGAPDQAITVSWPKTLQLADQPGTPPPRRRAAPVPMEPPPPPPPAYVAPSPPPPPPFVTWYWTLTMGAAFPNSLNFTAGGQGGTLDFGTGFTAFVGVGYRFSPWVAGELEAAFLWLPVSGGSFAGAGASIDGTSKAYGLFGNVVLTYPDWVTIQPYFGAGLGFVHRSSPDFTATVNGVSGSFDPGDATHFAMQVKAGVAFKITPTLSLAPEYRFIWINSAGNFNTAKVHSVGASLRWAF